MAAIDPALQRRPRPRVAPVVMEKIWKIESRPYWSATLRSDPSIVVTADGGDKLAKVATKLTVALLQGNLSRQRGSEELVGQVRGVAGTSWCQP